MASLVLGPLLRYAGETEAVIWVETDGPCEVEALGHRERTFQVAGHWYALVHATGLEPDSHHPYEVRLDGVRAWPEPDSPFPPSVVRTHGHGGAVRIAWGSCRLCVPHEPPWTLTKDEDPRGREPDALRVLADEMTRQAPEAWPHALVLLGDQVYADEVPPAVRTFIHGRRDTSVPPGEEIADFEEYTRLYRESWSEPHIRWLLSTVPSAMIFDDHDIHDDWNISDSWVRDMRATDWWDERIVSGLMSYWLYQHLGNLSPARLAEDEMYRRVRELEDGEAELRAFAYAADREVEGTRWSYARDFGATRLVMVDSRAGRVLEPGARRMVDGQERAWLEEHLVGGHDHVLVGSSLPFLLAPALHYLEAWSERVCDGAWGRLAARLGERIRRGLDLEHWSAFERSFEHATALIADLATGRRGDPPATIVALSGDVHHAYLAEVGFPPGTAARTAVWQATCSPFRNPLDAHERRALRFGWSRTGRSAARALARAAGVRDPAVRWRLAHPAPWFDNQVAFLVCEGRTARIELHKTVPHDEHGIALERVFARDLAPAGQRPEASFRLID